MSNLKYRLMSENLSSLCCDSHNVENFDMNSVCLDRYIASDYELKIPDCKGIRSNRTGVCIDLLQQIRLPLKLKTSSDVYIFETATVPYVNASEKDCVVVLLRYKRSGDIISDKFSSNKPPKHVYVKYTNRLVIKEDVQMAAKEIESEDKKYEYRFKMCLSCEIHSTDFRKKNV